MKAQTSNAFRFSSISIRQRMNRPMAFVALAMLMAATLGSMTGCTSLMTESSVPPVAGHSHGPSYKVIFGDGRKSTPKIHTGAINGSVTVQQALKDSGADRKYKNMRVDLARRTQSGEILKLPVHVDAKGIVMSEQNYALHPGDEILVRKAPNPGMFDGVFKNAQGKMYGM